MYLSDYYNSIVRRAKPNMFNILEAPMGSGKSHFIKEYIRNNPDKTCALVFFKNGKDDLLQACRGSSNASVFYYNELFKKIKTGELDTSNLTIFADEYDYLACVLESILYNFKESYRQLPNTAFTEESFNNFVNENRQFLDQLRQRCEYLYLVSATQLDDARYYRRGNKLENKLLKASEIDTLNKIRIESLIHIVREGSASLRAALEYLLNLNPDKYDRIYFYLDKIDGKTLNQIAPVFSNKNLVIPEYKWNSIEKDVRDNLCRVGWVWSSTYQRLNQETFDGITEGLVFINQSSNRGTSIAGDTTKDKRILIVHTGEYSANKLQSAGRFRLDSTKVDVAYITTKNIKSLNTSEYNKYCGVFKKHVVRRKQSNRSKKREFLDTYHTFEASPTALVKLAEQKGITITRQTVYNYRKEQCQE